MATNLTRASNRTVLLLTPILIIAGLLLLTSPSVHEFRPPFLGPPPPGPPGSLSPQYFPPPGHLRRWIEEEDERYSLVVKKRHEFAQRLGDFDAFPKNGAVWLLWDFFIPAFHCPHSSQRVGALGDGGKWICGMEVLEQQDRCVVYSFGISSDSSFEAEILERARGCEVWGYDFSVNGFGPQISQVAHLQGRAHFHKWGLGGKDAHDPSDNPPMYTLRSLMALNGHEFIDVLKIDIEGSEFEALSSFLNTLQPGEPLPFGQMQIEIHAWREYGAYPFFSQWWESLEAAGFRPFWTEPNLPYVNIIHARPELTEYSFINIYGNHPLIVD